MERLVPCKSPRSATKQLLATSSGPWLIPLPRGSQVGPGYSGQIGGGIAGRLAQKRPIKPVKSTKIGLAGCNNPHPALLLIPLYSK